MYTNRPSASPTAQNLPIDHAQDVAAGASDVRAPAAASASAVGASAATSGAAAAAPPATTRAALIAAVSASASGAAPEYIPPLYEEMLGIAAGYLEGDDQLTLRSMSPAVKVKTDQQIETLSMSPREAVAFFQDTAGLPNLKQLTINMKTINSSNVDVSDLDDFVDVLEHARYAPFELVLREKGLETSISADVLQRLSVLPLSGLTLHPTYNFDLARFAGLERAKFDLSISLDNVSGMRDFDVLVNLPSLTSLSMGDKVPSPTQAALLGSHPALTVLKTERRLIQPAELLPILSNRHLETLSVNWIAIESMEVIEALAGHPSITTLELGVIQKPALLSAIFQNPVIGSLQLTPYCLYPSVMHQIAEMPSLRTFTLTEGDASSPAPDAESLRALCTRPLASLSFEGVKLNEATIVIAAGAHAQSLTIQNNGGTSDQVHAQAGTLHQAAIAALVANPHVSSLSFKGHIVSGGAAQLAGAPGLKKLSIDIVSADETVESVQDAWQRVGKSLVDLTVSITAA